MISDKAKGLSSKEHIEHSEEIWLDGERRFKEACEFMRIPFREATKEEQFKHIDFVLSNGINVDVKGFKNTHQYGYILLEFKNVQGKAGWCSEESGADLISFDMDHHLMMVPVPWLIEFSRKQYIRIGKPPIVRSNKMPPYDTMLYKLYQRNGRQDLMMIITSTDLFKCPSYWFWRMQ